MSPKALAHLEIWTRALVSGAPVVGGPLEVLYSGYRNRASQRLLDFIAPIADVVRDPADLNNRLAESEAMDVTFGRAIEIAAKSADKRKRRLLGHALAQALADEAKIDEAMVITELLAQIDVPHIRALAGIEAAQSRAVEAGEREKIVAPRAERRISSIVTDEAARYPEPVITWLIALGLIEATAGGRVDTRYVYGLTETGEELLQELGNDDESSG